MSIIRIMKFREPGTTSTLIVLAALLVLLPLLAVLQYRWLARLSEREREHMNLNLRAIATRFSQDFDDEITRAYAFFSLSPERARAEGPATYAARYDRWITTAPYPKLIKDAYVALPDERGQLQLAQLRGDGGQYSAAQWPQSLAPLRTQLQQWIVADARVSMREIMSSRVRLVDGEGLALVNPIFSAAQVGQRPVGGPVPLSGFVILSLNPQEIEREILPALAKRHFSGTDSFDYSASILSHAPARQVIYHFGPDVPPGTKGDVSVGLMGLSRESFRRVMASLPPSEGGFFSVPRPPPPARQPAAAAPRPRRTDAARTPPDEEQKLWELSLTHRAGSLEAAVLSVRRRNLLISFGVLVLLGVSVALMMLSARRAQLLARRQLDFVAGVTHELRTPLSVIKSAAWSLRRGVVKDPEGIQRYSE
ncbi:MAG: histidine kinase dimerization/phospho-acceptor domain-containing protein, partial [Acidobacteriota bacterium]